MKVRALAIGLVALGLLAGCANVVNGTGTTRLSSGPVGPSASGATGFPSSSSRLPTEVPPTTAASSATLPPSSSASTPAENFHCPAIVDPGTHLEYNCITTPMTFSSKDKVWPHDFYDIVEPSTGWAVTEGSGHWGSTGGHSLLSICKDVRQQMIDHQNYGTSPQVTTTGAIKATINGVHGLVLESRFRLSQAYRASHNEAVKIEKSWTVAINVGPDDVSLWYVSIPDISSSLWSKVHDTIASIHVI